jgi:hypothetical protein
MTLWLKKKTLEYTFYAKHYVYVNTLVRACKGKLVLNEETSFEAIDRSGGIDPFIFNVGTTWMWSSESRSFRFIVDENISVP